MRIGIDIDDTITNTSLKMLEYMDKLGIEQNGDDYCNYTVEDLDKYKDLLRKYIEPVLSTCTLKRDCVKVINKLKEMGNSIYIITARSNRYSDNIYDITKKYLEDYKISYDELFFGYEDKKDICIEQKIDYMIDDNIDVYNSLVGTNTKPILFGKEATKSYDCIRVNNWDEILDLIK